MEVSNLCALLGRLDLSCSIKNLLQNELRGKPVLHTAIALPGENKIQIVKALIEAGADCDRRDENGLTPCECALTVLGDRELASEMIAAELNSLEDARAFYSVIRRGSLAVFKLFLVMRKFGEGDLFELITNAMVELNAKKVQINEELEAFFQYHLAEYAFRHLCSDSKINKNVNEWRMHFKVIADNWSELKKRYNGLDYANIDNMFVHRIETIHNHIYFIKNKQFLKHLPIMEIVFCLAIFAAIFKGKNKFMIFKWVINKLIIMQFLDVICRQLGKVERYLNTFEAQLNEMLGCLLRTEEKLSKELLMSYWATINPLKELEEHVINKIINKLRKGQRDTIISEVIDGESFRMPIKINKRDRSALARLRRCYFRTKQLYSTQKCIFHIQSLPRDKKSALADPSSGPAIKRVLQVIGEAIKSTKNSPNLSKKGVTVLDEMLSDKFSTTNKNLREFFSHKHSMASKFLSKLSDKNGLLEITVEQFTETKITFLIIFLCSTVEASRSLLGSMRRCQSTSRLRSLLQYIGDQTIAIDYQKQQFITLEDTFQEMSETLSSQLSKVKGKIMIDAMKREFESKRSILHRIRRCLTSEWNISFEDIKVAYMGKAELSTIHRMIDCNLTNCDQSEIFDFIKAFCKKTKFDNEDMVKNLEPNRETIPPMLNSDLVRIQRKLGSLEEDQNADDARKILENLGQTDASLGLVDNLHKQLSKYYENIFSIDNKFQTIKRLFKCRKLPINQECFNRMRKQDEKYLQNIYNDIINDMRQILETHGLSSVESWAVKYDKISDQVLLALEFCQLELCQIFISVGYFGDNFHLLKHRMPFMHGRNYRNYLAHDPLSYNILTGSSHFKVIANALVMVNNPINLFGKHATNTVKIINYVTSDQTLKWAMIQTDLAKSIRQMDSDNVQWGINAGADLLGEFCLSIGDFDTLKFDVKSVQLIDPNCSKELVDKVKAICESIITSSTIDVTSPTYRSWYAFIKGETATAVDIFSRNQPLSSLSLPKYLYYSEYLVDHLTSESLQSNDKDQFGRTILQRFVRAGNYRGVEQVLNFNPDVDINEQDSNGRSVFDLAIIHGFLKIAKLLSTKSPQISVDCQQLIIVNHLNDLLPMCFDGSDDILMYNETYMKTAIRANNCEALEHIVGHLSCGHISYGIYLAASYNHQHIVEFLLNLPNMDINAESEYHVHLALVFAIDTRNWSTVELLLERGAFSNKPHRIRHNYKSAFEMAIEARSCKLLHMMKKYHGHNYYIFNHPLITAVEGDSPKVIRYLLSIGFSLLDNNGILTKAVENGNMEYVNLVFHALDASLDVWKSYESVLGMVGHLLSRWIAIGYMEERGIHRTIPFLQAMTLGKWDLASLLLDKSRELRNVNDHFISDIEVYTKQGMMDSTKSAEILKYCNDLQQLLEHFVKCEKQSRIVPIICHTSTDVQLNWHRIIHGNSSTSESHCAPIISNSYTKHASTCQEIIIMAMQSIKSPHDFMVGTFQENSEVVNYLLVSQDISCQFELSKTEPPQLLKSLVNSKNDKGYTSLHMAAMHKGKWDLMKFLLDNGANPSAQNVFALTPLYISLIHQECSENMLFIKYCFENDLKSSDGTPILDIPDYSANSPIHYAAEVGRLPVVQLLLQCGVNMQVSNMNNYLPFNSALISENLEILRLFLDYNPELVNIVNRNGQTLLHHSTQMEDDVWILLLLEYEVDLTVKDRGECTAVEKAIREYNFSWLKIVLFYARVNGVRGLLDYLYDREKAPLHSFMFSNNGELFRAIIEYEMDQDFYSDQNLSSTSLRKLHDLLTSRSQGLTALHVAVQNKHMELAEMFLHCQSKYNQQSEEKIYLQKMVDYSGKSPLDYAMSLQNEALISMFLKISNKNDSSGSSLLDDNEILIKAVENDNLHYVNLALQVLDAAVDEWKHDRGVPVMVGQLLSRWKAIGFLEERGSNPTTAFLQAVTLGKSNFVSLFLDKCRELRKVSDHFICGIELYTKQGLLDSTQSTEKIRYCCVLLDLLKDYVKCGTEPSRIVPVFCHSLKDIQVDCYRITFGHSSTVEFNATSVPPSSYTNNAFNFQDIITQSMQLIKNSRDLMLGTIQENPNILNYFIASKDVFCWFQLSETEPTQLLKSLVNSKNYEGDTPLHLFAKYKGNWDLMKSLLNNGANLSVLDSCGNTPLHISLMFQESSENMHLLKYCFENDLKSSDGSSLLEIPDNYGNQPIHYAVEYGRVPVVKLLLELGVDVRVMNKNSMLPVAYAVKSGNPEILRLFLDYDPELVNTVVDIGNGITLLHYSTLLEDDAWILLLLEFDVDITAKLHDSFKAIENAIHKGKTSWLKIVLFYARVNGIQGLLDAFNALGKPVLHSYVLSNNVDLVKTVIEYEIDQDLFSEHDLSSASLRKLHDLLNSRWCNGDYTALHIAAIKEYMESTEVVLHYQSMYNRHSENKIYLQKVVDSHGLTPLNYAMYYKNKVLINMLLAKSVENDLSKVSRNLQSIEPSLLDDNEILITAVRNDDMIYVNLVFQALDATVDEWKSYEGVLGMVGQLLSRWKATGYLEERGSNRTIAFLQAISQGKWDVVSLLLDKSRELRKVNDHFISDIEVYTKQGLLDSTQSAEMFKYCDDLQQLLDHFVKCEKQSRIVPLICHTSKDIQVKWHRIIHGNSSTSESHCAPILSNSFRKNASNCQEIITLAMQSIENPHDFMVGTFQENSEVVNYLLASKDISCRFQLSETEPPQLLKSLVNSKDAEGFTPLHIVAKHKGKWGLMKFLLDNGANPSAQNVFSAIPLHISMVLQECSENMLFVKYCFENDVKSSDGTSVLEMPGRNGTRSIHCAAAIGKLSIVQFLLKLGVNVRLRDKNGHLPVYFALNFKNLEILRLFLEYDPELVNAVVDKGSTMLHLSITLEDAWILLLLEYDVDITVKDQNGLTAVTEAMYQGKTSWLKIVLFYARVNGILGIFEDLYDRGEPPLYQSIMTNNGELVRAVIEYEIDQDLYSDQDLSDASLLQLRDLLTNRAQGITALHLAVQIKNVTLVKMILHCQSRYNQNSEDKVYLADTVDYQGKTPLDYAMQAQNEALINILLTSL